MSKFLRISTVFILIFAWTFSGWPNIQIAEAVTTETFTTTTTWTAPTGVTSVQAEVWGGGGGGGGENATTDGGGGGGGGAYSKKNTITVVPGNNYTVTVGTGGTGNAGCTASTAGGDSWFSSTATVLAKGGSPGACSTGTPPAGGAGGAAASGIGDTTFSGGQGEKGRNSNAGLGGYGGSSAGTAADGWSGPQTWNTATYPTANTPTGGGHGGDGGATADAAGSAPASGNGGGGGGAADGTNISGGNGAGGKVILTYNKPPNAPSQDSPANSATGVSVTPTFLMTATDADTTVDNLSYKVTIYSNSACTTVVQTNDQAVSSTGWTGTDATCTASPTACYLSGTQGSFLTQTALSASTQYWWKASAKDPDGNGSFTDSSTCNTFTTGVAPTVSCSASIISTDFGTLDTGSVFTSSQNASTTMSCTFAGGCTLSVADAGNGSNPGLATTSPAYLIPSPNAAFSPTAVLAAGTEGYGITATTTAGGSGGTLAIYSRYDHDSGGNTVGGLKLTAFGVASSTSAITNRQLTIKHKAAISNLSNAAKYVDTITYSCTGN